MHTSFVRTHGSSAHGAPRSAPGGGHHRSSGLRLVECRKPRRLLGRRRRPVRELDTDTVQGCNTGRRKHRSRRAQHLPRQDPDRRSRLHRLRLRRRQGNRVGLHRRLCHGVATGHRHGYHAQGRHRGHAVPRSARPPVPTALDSSPTPAARCTSTKETVRPETPAETVLRRSAPAGTRSLQAARTRPVAERPPRRLCHRAGAPPTTSLDQQPALGGGDSCPARRRRVRPRPGRALLRRRADLGDQPGHPVPTRSRSRSAGRGRAPHSPLAVLVGCRVHRGCQRVRGSHALPVRRRRPARSATEHVRADLGAPRQTRVGLGRRRRRRPGRRRIAHEPNTDAPAGRPHPPAGPRRARHHPRQATDAPTAAADPLPRQERRTHMRTTSRTALALAGVAAALVAGLAGCSSNNTPSTATKASPGPVNNKVGILLPDTSSSPRWVSADPDRAQEAVLRLQAQRATWTTPTAVRPRSRHRRRRSSTPASACFWS